MIVKNDTDNLKYDVKVYDEVRGAEVRVLIDRVTVRDTLDMIVETEDGNSVVYLQVPLDKVSDLANALLYAKSWDWVHRPRPRNPQDTSDLLAALFDNEEDS